ncbi:hypothetical protein Q3G72_006723 [Acer saccharum]|nr:hypothetical protein Q3G72_006723 [Acer saccharum]
MSYMGDCISPECRPLRRRLCQSSKKGSNNERCLSLPGAYCRKDGKVLLQLCYSRPAEDRCCMQRPKSRDVQRVYTSQSVLVRLGDPQHLSSKKLIIHGFNDSSQIRLGKERSNSPLTGKSTRESTFHVIDAAPSYYLLRGRNWLHQHQAIASIFHQSLKYLENRVDVIAPGNLKPFEEEEEHYVEASVVTSRGRYKDQVSRCLTHQERNHSADKWSLKPCSPDRGRRVGDRTKVQDRKEDFVLSDPAFVHLFFSSSIEKAWAQELVEPLVDRESSAQRVPTGRSPVAQDPSLTEEESARRESSNSKGRIVFSNPLEIRPGLSSHVPGGSIWHKQRRHMRWGERKFTSLLRSQFQLNPQQNQHRNPLLSWDQLLVFDIELDNQKLPLLLSLLLEGARSLNGSAIATFDMLGTPPLMDLESSEMKRSWAGNRFDYQLLPAHSSCHSLRVVVVLLSYGERMGIPVMSSKDFSGYLLYGMSGRRRVFRDAKNSGEKRSSLYSIPDVRTDTELVGGLTRANLLLDSRVAQ